MSFITAFIKGKWIGKAKDYVSNSSKMKALLSQLNLYLSKKGVRDIKDSLILMRNYLSDIATGKYQDYSKSNLLLVIAAVLYVVSPLDFLPDLIPGGLIDDVTIVLWVVNKIGEELTKYKGRVTKGNSPAV